MLLLLLTVLACIVAWVYWRWVKVRNFWAERGVPYSAPHPIFGSLTFLQQINPAIWMRQIYDKFQAPYVGVWMFWRPALIVNDPEIARNILVKDAANFRDRFLGAPSPHDTIGSYNIFTVKDPMWSNMRRRLTPVFTSSKLKAVQTLLLVKSKELVQRLAAERKKGRFNGKTVYNDFTSDVIGITTLGIQSDATLTGESPIRTVTKEFETYSLYRGINWCSIFFFPELVGIFRFRLFPKSATDYFRRIFAIVVEQRKKEIRETAEPRDLMDILLKIKKDSIAENEEISDEMLISQAAVFIQGGFDTTGSNISFTTYELAYNSEVQERLYTELKEAQDAAGGGDMDDNILCQLTYLNCVIKETLRKYQPMGWLDRISSDEYKVDDKLTIPAATPVYVNAIGMHYDPEYFPDPEVYNPDRFLPENEAKIQKYTFIPFGEGPRNCIGQRFALANVRIALSQIVLNFKLQPFPDTPIPRDIQIDRHGLFLAPGEPLYVDYVPRN